MDIPTITLDELRVISAAKYGPPGPEHDLMAYLYDRTGFEARARQLIPGIETIRNVWVGYVSSMDGEGPEDDVEFVVWGQPEKDQLIKPETRLGKYEAMTMHGNIETGLPISVVEYEGPEGRRTEFVPADINGPRVRIILVDGMDYSVFGDQ